MLGCACQGPQDLVIATNWTAAECVHLERDFRNRTGANIIWVRLDPWEDPMRRLDHRLAADVVLGGPPESYRALANEGRIEASWRIARNAPIGLGVVEAALRERAILLPNDWRALADPRFEGLVALDDPRHAPATLAWMRARLAAGRWAEGYAELVRAASRARPIGRRGGAAEADLRRGEAGASPIAGKRADLPVLTLPGGGTWTEGVAMTTQARNPALAEEFLRAFPAPASGQAEADPRAIGLLADLLGAALVEAQQELWAARDALAKAGRPAHLEMLLTQAPPWPPASIEKMDRSADPDVLKEKLAELIAPEEELRAWLLRSWKRPKRPIDGRFLDELAAVGEGRLVDHPRFRAWLRGEWTAWCRQSYRRVARRAQEQAVKEGTS